MLAATKVGHDTYLVEVILDGMAMHDIARLQRVSRMWSDTIKHSKRLQQQLFLTAIPAHAPIRIDKGIEAQYCFCDRSAATHASFIAPNPLLQITGILSGFNHGHAFAAGAIFLLPRTHTRAKHPTSPRPNTFEWAREPTPSWLNAFVTQPSLTELKGTAFEGSEERLMGSRDASSGCRVPSADEVPWSLSRAQGIRFRDVFDRIGSLLVEPPASRVVRGRAGGHALLRWPDHLDILFHCERLPEAEIEGIWTKPRALRARHARDVVVWWSRGNAGLAPPLLNGQG